MIDVWMIRAHLIQGSLFPGSHPCLCSFVGAGNCATAMKLSLSFVPFTWFLWLCWPFLLACALSCYLSLIMCSLCSIFPKFHLAWIMFSQEWLLALESHCLNCLLCCSNRDILDFFGCMSIWWIRRMTLNDFLLFESFQGFIRCFDILWQYLVLQIWPNLLISKYLWSYCRTESCHLNIGVAIFLASLFGAIWNLIKFLL